ncbi:MAG TPA: M48 family metallopeptidase [Candidatus Elarobacter sp.]|nr:M48 family metallopeptidase [Candidatus Elarobacter sp.]
MSLVMKRIAILTAAALLGGCAVSQQQEVQMGQQYSAEISQQLPLINDPVANRYINVLGDSIARLTSRGDLDWHFYIVNSPEVNAFAVPGGFVYVNRGLIERADKMDELAGVLGHEIGHVVRRHTVKQMQQQQGANLGVTLACILTSVCNNQATGTAIQVGGSALFAKFSRSDEAQADEEGVKNTIRAHISPEGIVTMFQKLIQERKSQPAAVDGWFATHPMEEDRIAEVQRMISAYPPGALSGLTKDSQNFHAFKTRLASLPAPPPQRTGR